jgi:peptide chain release factor 1
MENIQSEKSAALSQNRRAQIGGAERSEKIRTYNFPDRRITDHRINLTLHKFDAILGGDLDGFIDALLTKENELNA